MGKKVEKGFRKGIAASESPKLSQDGIPAFDQASGKSPTKRKKGASPGNTGVKQPEPSADSGVGLRPFKVTHGTDPSSRTSLTRSSILNALQKLNESSAVRETLFFVSHSSSGLATSMNVSTTLSLLLEI